MREMHAAAGFDWDFPEDAISAYVWVDENDEPVVMAGGRVLAEAFLISSQKETPQRRLEIIAQLMQVVGQDVARLGIREGVAWIPDSIWKAYSRRLKRFGWKAIRYRSMVWKVRE